MAHSGFAGLAGSSGGGLISYRPQPLHLPDSRSDGKIKLSIENRLFEVGRPDVAKKSKDARSYVKMQSSESSHCYFLQKNRNNTKDRMQLRKYDPIVRKHVIYKEGKM